jgi:hypothetical protein
MSGTREVSDDTGESEGAGEGPRPFGLPPPEAFPPGDGCSYFLWHSSHFTGPFFSF